ncbi:MAG: hypothetical protein M3443_11270 [Actinomycetota bacterium]|nr:hypothetical protein [Actinomycetota bacterium]
MFVLAHVGQSTEHGFLLGQQVSTVEQAAHVPVGGMQHPHADNGRTIFHPNGGGTPVERSFELNSVGGIRY